jgi:hypothetical protein
MWKRLWRAPAASQQQQQQEPFWQKQAQNPWRQAAFSGVLFLLWQRRQHVQQKRRLTAQIWSQLAWTQQQQSVNLCPLLLRHLRQLRQKRQQLMYRLTWQM